MYGKSDDAGIPVSIMNEGYQSEPRSRISVRTASRVVQEIDRDYIHPMQWRIAWDGQKHYCQAGKTRLELVVSKHRKQRFSRTTHRSVHAPI